MYNLYTTYNSLLTAAMLSTLGQVWPISWPWTAAQFSSRIEEVLWINRSVICNRVIVEWGLGSCSQTDKQWVMGQAFLGPTMYGSLSAILIDFLFFTHTHIPSIVHTSYISTHAHAHTHTHAHVHTHACTHTHTAPLLCSTPFFFPPNVFATLGRRTF